MITPRVVEVFAAVESVLSLGLDLDRLLKRLGDLDLDLSLMRRGGDLDLDRLLMRRRGDGLLSLRGGDLDLDLPLAPTSLILSAPNRTRSLSGSRLSLLLSTLRLLLLIQGLLSDRSLLLLRLLL